MGYTANMIPSFETIWSGFVAVLRRLNGETVTPGRDSDPMGDRVWARDQLTNDAGFLHGHDSMGDGGGGGGGLSGL